MKKWLTKTFLTTIFSISIVGITSTTIISWNNQKNISYNNDLQKNRNIKENFLEKIKNNSYTRLINKSYLDFTLSDWENNEYRKINIENNNLMYNPNDFESIKTQTKNAITSINKTNLNNFLNDVNNLTEDINNTLMITAIKPKLQYISISKYDNYWPDSDAWKSVGIPEHEYTIMVQGPGITWHPEKYKASASIWKDCTDVEYQSVILHPEGTTTTSWYDLKDNMPFLNTKQDQYWKIWLRLKNDKKMTFPLIFPSGSVEKTIYVSDEIKIENDEYKFTIGSKGYNKTEIVHKIGRTNNMYYRAIFEITAKKVPQIKIDEKTLNIINDDYPIKKDFLYNYVSIKNKNKFNSLINCFDFEEKRNDIIKKINELKKNKKYSTAINDYISDSKNEIINKIKMKKTTINSLFNINQYDYEIPTILQSTHGYYNVSNNNLLHMKKYSGINNLLTHILVFDESTGVKNKFKDIDNTYNSDDYHKLGFKFKFDNEFFDLFNKIDEYNKLIIELNNKNKNNVNVENALKSLWNFTYDINKYDGNIANLINNQENININNDVRIFLKNNFGFNPKVSINSKEWYFYHNLPQLIAELCNQMTITCAVEQANQLESNNVIIFDKNEFKTINFNDNLLSKNEYAAANNLAIMKIYNINIKNKFFTIENTSNFDCRKMIKNHDFKNTIQLNKEYIKYEISYRNDYQNLQPINGKLTQFKVTKDIDKLGYIASDYFNPENKKITNHIIKRIVEENIGSIKGYPIIFDNNIQMVTNLLIEENNNLHNLIRKYKIDTSINNNEGIFYALVQIENSNDMKNFGDKIYPEIINNQMWYVESDLNNPKARKYLIKIQSLKKNITINTINFFADRENNAIQMEIKNQYNKEIIPLFLNIDNTNKIKRKQEINIPTLQYFKIDTSYSYEEYQYLIKKFERTLFKLNLGLFRENTIFNFKTNQITFDIYDITYDKLNFEIKNHPNNSNILFLMYKLDNLQEIKYEVEYKLIEKDKLKIIVNKNDITNKECEIYILPYLKEITKFLKNEISQKYGYEIDSINLDLSTFTGLIKFKEKTIITPSPNNKTNTNIIIFSILISIFGISIIGVISWIIYKKHKK